MPFWYFFNIPDLPQKVSHQSNTVEIREYLVTEGDKVRSGTPLALIENLDQHSPYSVVDSAHDDLVLMWKLNAG
jgi:hypothetical protein